MYKRGGEKPIFSTALLTKNIYGRGRALLHYVFLTYTNIKAALTFSLDAYNPTQRPYH